MSGHPFRAECVQFGHVVPQLRHMPRAVVTRSLTVTTETTPVTTPLTTPAAATVPAQLSMPRVEIFFEGISIPPPELLDDLQWELMQMDMRALIAERLRRARHGLPPLGPGEWAVCEAGKASWAAMTARAAELGGA
jgi:hypothetical protein